MDALATEMPFWAQRKRENRSALRSGAHASEEISTYSQVGAGPQRDANRSRAVQHDPHALATPPTGPPDQTAQAQTAPLYVRVGLATHLLLRGRKYSKLERRERARTKYVLLLAAAAHVHKAHQRYIHALHRTATTFS